MRLGEGPQVPARPASARPTCGGRRRCGPDPDQRPWRGRIPWRAMAGSAAFARFWPGSSTGPVRAASALLRGPGNGSDPPAGQSDPRACASPTRCRHQAERPLMGDELFGPFTARAELSLAGPRDRAASMTPPNPGPVSVQPKPLGPEPCWPAQSSGGSASNDVVHAGGVRNCLRGVAPAALATTTQKALRHLLPHHRKRAQTAPSRVRSAVPAIRPTGDARPDQSGCWMNPCQGAGAWCVSPYGSSMLLTCPCDVPSPPCVLRPAVCPAPPWRPKGMW